MGGITKGPVATNGYELEQGEYQQMLNRARNGHLDPESARIATRCQFFEDHYRKLAKDAIDDPSLERKLPGYAGPSDSVGCDAMHEAVDV